METPDHSKDALPSAFQEHLGTVAEFYARHNQDLSPAQRAVERISFFLGSPGYVVGNLVFVGSGSPGTWRRPSWASTSGTSRHSSGCKGSSP